MSSLNLYYIVYKYVSVLSLNFLLLSSSLRLKPATCHLRIKRFARPTRTFTLDRMCVCAMGLILHLPTTTTPHPHSTNQLCACVPVSGGLGLMVVPVRINCVCRVHPHVRPRSSVRPVVSCEHACRQYSPVAFPRLLTWLELGQNMGVPWRTKEGEGESKLHQ